MIHWRHGLTIILNWLKFKTQTGLVLETKQPTISFDFSVHASHPYRQNCGSVVNYFHLIITLTSLYSTGPTHKISASKN